MPSPEAAWTAPAVPGITSCCFADLGKQDACTNPSCYQAKVNAHIAATVAAKPKLVQISTLHAQQREGSAVLPRNQYVTIREDKPADKEQAKWPQFKTCKYATEAITRRDRLSLLRFNGSDGVTN
ncbi:MAG: hypothetical protein ACRD3K_07535, partial [Edaphobacter sp.]